MHVWTLFVIVDFMLVTLGMLLVGSLGYFVCLSLCLSLCFGFVGVMLAVAMLQGLLCVQ